MFFWAPGGWFGSERRRPLPRGPALPITAVEPPSPRRSVLPDIQPGWRALPAPGVPRFGPRPPLERALPVGNVVMPGVVGPGLGYEVVPSRPGRLPTYARGKLFFPTVVPGPEDELFSNLLRRALDTGTDFDWDLYRKLKGEHKP